MNEQDWAEALTQETETFQLNVMSLTSLINETEEDIQTLEKQKQALLDVKNGTGSSSPSASSSTNTAEAKDQLFLQASAVAETFLQRLRTVRANRDALAKAAAEGQEAMGPDGKPLKRLSTPEMKLLHKLTVRARPGLLTPLPALEGADGGDGAESAMSKSSNGGSSGGFFKGLKKALQTDEDRAKGREKQLREHAASADPEAQAVFRLCLDVDTVPGLRFSELDGGTAVEVASVSFTLRTDPPPGTAPLTAAEADDLAAFVNVSIHNALTLASASASDSGVVAELQQTRLAERAAVRQAADALAREKEVAKRILETMVIDVTAVALPTASTAAGGGSKDAKGSPAPPPPPQAFTVTVTVKQKPTPGLREVLQRVIATAEYQEHQRRVEQAYAVLELFAVQGFNITVEGGVAAQPPTVQDRQQQEDQVTARTAEVKRRARYLWEAHRDLFTEESAVVETVKSVAREKQAELERDGRTAEEIAEGKVAELKQAIRPVVHQAISTGVLPALHRTICPPLANTVPLETAVVAANLFSVVVRRAPRELVKLGLNAGFDAAARSALQDAPDEAAGKAAARRIAVSKAKLSTGLSIYDDLHVDVAHLPYKSDGQRRRATTLLSHADRFASAAVERGVDSIALLLRDTIAERRAIQHVRQKVDEEGTSALADTANVLAAVLRAVNTLSRHDGAQPLSRARGRYDVTLCGCEAASPLAARFVAKPPPSAPDGVEAARISLALAMHPAPAFAQAFEGRKDNMPCRCDVFNNPVRMLLADLALLGCDAVETHSPVRDRMEV